MYYLLSILLFSFCLIVGTPSAFANTSVFFIKKSLKMENDEKPMHDYYINAGSRVGLKRGMVVKVHRKVPFQDTGMIKLNEQLEIPIVEIKLIHVQGELSVGRLHKRLIGKDSPILDYSNIMMGDSVNIGSKRWPKRGERSAYKAPVKKKKRVATKPKPRQEEGQQSFSSVQPKVTPKAVEEMVKPKTPEVDERAKSIPVGGEFLPNTL